MTEKQGKLLEQKKAVLKKFYGGKREPWMHKLRVSDGVCEYCGTHIKDAIKEKWGRMCSIITSDEVAKFRYEE